MARNSTNKPDRLDLNKATPQEIQKTVLFIGPKKAEAIVRHRDMHGPYKSLDELSQTIGLGAKHVSALEDYFYVDDVA